MGEINPIPPKSMRESSKRWKIPFCSGIISRFYPTCDGKEHPGVGNGGEFTKSHPRCPLGLPGPAQQSHTKVFYCILPALNNLLGICLSGAWWVDDSQIREHLHLLAGRQARSLSFTPRGNKKKTQPQPKNTLKVQKFKKAVKKPPLENSIPLVWFPLANFFIK